MTSLEELTAITTHDDNLERQYKEGKLIEAEEAAIIAVCMWLVVAENTKLQNELEKARYEIRVCRNQFKLFRLLSSLVVALERTAVYCSGNTVHIIVHRGMQLFIYRCPHLK